MASARAIASLDVLAEASAASCTNLAEASAAADPVDRASPRPAVKAFSQSRVIEDIQKEIASVRGQIAQLDDVILESRIVLRLLREHVRRLIANAEDPRTYRVSVLVNRREVFVTLDQSGLENISNSLALRDLLKKYRSMKGIFRSHDPADWKRILIRSSIKAKDHLRSVEIPAVEKRMGEVEKKISALEDERFALHEKLKR